MNYLTYTNHLTQVVVACFVMAVKPIPHVDEASAKLAHAWQERIQKLPPQTGILFVAVAATAVVGGKCHSFDFVLGLKEGVAIGTAVAVIQHFFEEELLEYRISITAYPGVVGPAAATSHEGAGRHPEGSDDRS